MKNKPQRHKESNVFRFKSFGDRINEIDLRRTALYHIKHVNEETADDVEETEFHQTYCKWIVLNLTEEYNEFQKKIRHIVTLPQLIHREEFVVTALLDALEKGTVLALQPLLEFVVALARDLREEFYPHFQSFLERLVALLNTKEADQLEWTLVTLAYLFKIMKPFLKKDLTVVFNSIMPLLELRNAEHVTNFAAECFSFVARDIKDKGKFLALMLNLLRAHRNGVAGCARLLVEIVRGVNGQFHSCAELYLRTLFEALAKPKQFKRELLHEVLDGFVDVLLKHIHPGHVQLFWDVGCQVLESQIGTENAAADKLMDLFGRALNVKDGKYLANSNQFVSILMKVLAVTDASDECLERVAELTATLLLAKSVTITQLDASRIVKKVLTIPSSQVFESFVWNCVDFSQFEVLILPEFLRYLDKHFQRPALELLTKIILSKSPLCRDGSGLSKKSLYPIRMRSEKCIEQVETMILSQTDVDLLAEDPGELCLAAIIYPHIIGVNAAPVYERLTELVDAYLERLNAEQLDDVRNKRLIFIVSILVETQIQLTNSLKTGHAVKRVNLTKFVERILPFCHCENYRHIVALRTLDLIVSHEANRKPTADDFNRDLFVRIHDDISDNLSSRYHDVRLITAHLFDQFSTKLKIKGTDHDIYSIFYAIESIEPNIHTYREQLLHLQKVEPSARLFGSLDAVHESCKLDAVKFLFGCLYVNFQLLWKPVSELIQAYFAEVDLNDFWEIMKIKLNEATQLQRTGVVDDVQDDEAFLNGISCIQDEYLHCWRNTERSADLVNYRILLWRMVPTLGALSEVKNREIVSSFLDFVDHEYRKTIDHDTFTWNILKRSDPSTETDGKAVAEEDEEELPEADVELQIPKGTQRTLSTMLQAFIHQPNPKQLHREPELWTFYLKLLSHRNAAVQKLALDCIVAYKHKYVQPYKDHLYNLVDESKFKEAITNFKIDKEANLVQPEHRNQLMPIVMPILFSKMLSRQSGQKGSNQIRKSLVMRFLGGCHEDEILIMLNMSFWLYESSFDDDVMHMCQRVIESVELNKVLSPRKLQSSLDLIDVIQGEFSGLMSEKFHRYILKLLLVIGSFAQGVIIQHERNPSLISSKMATTFKNVRGTCILNLQRFFQHFESYAWSDNEIDAIFHIFVSPLAGRLAHDGQLSVTPLLKLLVTFGKAPRLFILLTRHTTVGVSTEDTTPLRMMMDLLNQPRAQPKVCLAIMETIQSLLTLKEDDGDGDDATTNALNISHCLPVDPQRLSNIENSEFLNFGNKILLPHLGAILLTFKMKLKKRRGLTKRDLSILSRITELINDPETCNTLLTVLLPILVRKSHASAGEETLMQMVNTIINLFGKIDRPERHIRNIAPMFQQITAVGPRKRLCDLLRVISDRYSGDAKRKAELETLVDVVNDLNAWDRRWVEQPDYEKRLNAYKRVAELSAENRVDINLGLLIIYHSFYFIKYDKDMAMRDSASHHLKTLVPALIRRCQREQPFELDYLIGTVILNLVRRTLRDRNDAMRNEGILLLGEMARECPDAHPVLFDLHSLTCKTDREIDFFENVTHLQSLRHGRALLRFCTVAKTYEKAPSSRTLTQFILPLASNYLSSEKYAAKHGLVTSAIETIGAVCRLLPWHQYESILKYYLKSMRFNVEYQKQMVRIVVHILDSFHFDLSRANIVPSELPKPSVEKVEEPNVDEVEPETTIDAKEDGEEDVIIDQMGSDDERLDDELDAINQGDGDEDEDEEEDVAPVKKARICVYDTPVVLSQSIAKKLVHSIATGLISTLNNSITAISTYESFHKLNKKKRRSEREEEEILRVPIALAMVKLLQKLPEGILEQHLSGIFIKVCMFLRSPLVSVRMTTRDILKNIMLTVGAVHLDTLLTHMTSMLTRGFQVHVLTITIHSILDALKTSLKNGIMDKSLQSVLDVCLRDIFGQTGEEKEITKIGKHTPEAKPHNKSFLTLSICATNISEKCLIDLLLPFKDYLSKSQSKKIVLRVQECFQKIVTGLTVNKTIPIESMLMFIHGIVSESIPDLLPGIAKPILSEAEKEKIRRERPDCFLIPVDPASDGRSGAVKKVVVTNVRANAHVLIEFGLELLQMTLRRGKLLKINYQPFIDPIVPILCDSLTSAHVRVTTFALKSLSTMLSKEMTSEKIDELTPKVAAQIFTILHKYVAANTEMSAENFNLVQSAFKTIVNMLRCLPADKYTMEADQLEKLLFYVQQYLDVGDAYKQTISFSLLKVILGRQLNIGRLNDVMMQVGRLAIQSESGGARQESKGIIVNYLMGYPLGKKIEGFIQFFLTNLDYGLQSGRESAINILHSIAKRFPTEYLSRHCAVMFVRLGMQLINDESVECREQIAECIETLLTRIDVNRRDELFAHVLSLLGHEGKVTHREMGAVLCSRFVNAEKQKFESRIEKLLPLLIGAITLTRTGHNSDNVTGQFVRLNRVEADEDGDDMDDEEEEKSIEAEKQRAIDHQLIQVQNTLAKVFERHQNAFIANSQYVDELAYESQKLLAYEHVWVRLNALHALQLILPLIDCDEIHRLLTDAHHTKSKAIEFEFLYGNPEREIKALTLDLCAQLIPDDTDKEMADAVTANLLFIANMLKDVPFGNAKKDDENDDDEDNDGAKEKPAKINLAWLLRRMRYVVHAEVAKAPHSIVLRSSVFGWIEGVVELCSVETVQKLAYTILSPLVREMSEEDQNIDARLRAIAIRVGDVIRGKIGDDEYNILRVQIQRKLMIKRAERKRSIAMEKVNDPERAAYRQKGIRDRKKVAKRKHIDVRRGKIVGTKKRMKFQNDNF